MSKKTEFLEKIYFHELDRKQGLENMFALPSGVIAGLFGLIGYYFTKFNFGQIGPWVSVIKIGFLAAAVAAVALLLLASFWCALAVNGSEYEHLPGAKTLDDYWHELENWHKINRSRFPKNKSDADFESFLEDAYARCSQKNWKTNLYRSEELFRAKRAITYAIFVVVILSICYYINFWLGSLPTNQ